MLSERRIYVTHALFAVLAMALMVILSLQDLWCWLYAMWGGLVGLFTGQNLEFALKERDNRNGPAHRPIL